MEYLVHLDFYFKTLTGTWMPLDLMGRSAAVRLLGLRVRIPAAAWMSVS